MTKVNRFAQANWQNKKKRQSRLQYLDAMRKTQTRLSAGGPKQKSACAWRTETRHPHFSITREPW
jgi:hypothetical protein